MGHCRVLNLQSNRGGNIEIDRKSYFKIRSVFAKFMTKNQVSYFLRLCVHMHAYIGSSTFLHSFIQPQFAKRSWSHYSFVLSYVLHVITHDYE